MVDALRHEHGPRGLGIRTIVWYSRLSSGSASTARDSSALPAHDVEPSLDPPEARTLGLIYYNDAIEITELVVKAYDRMTQ